MEETNRTKILDFSYKSCIMWEKVVESGRTPVAPAFTS